MTTWIDGLQPTCGPLLGAARRFTATQGLALDPPRGSQGLGELAKRLQRAAEQPMEAEHERAFVEGAGAYLGLLLVDHFGEGGHAAFGNEHRVRLGRYGFIDPFASVTRALDADDVGAQLLAEVGRAEAEARGRGGLSRVVREVERHLERTRGGRIVRQFDRQLQLQTPRGSVELDVSQVVEATSDQGGQAVRAAVEYLLSGLQPDSICGHSLAEVQRWLLPRVVAREFVDRLQQEGGPRLATRPLVNGLNVALLLQQGRRARFVRAAELGDPKFGPSEAHQAALRNLAATAGRTRFMLSEGVEGRFAMARSGDGLDAARLLLPGLHDVLAPALGTPFVAAIPHRDVLYACCNQPDAVAVLRRRVTEDAEAAPHAITQRLLLVGTGARISAQDT